jgi:hypothetical protein
VGTGPEAEPRDEPRHGRAELRLVRSGLGELERIAGTLREQAADDAVATGDTI